MSVEHIVKSVAITQVASTDRNVQGILRRKITREIVDALNGTDIDNSFLSTDSALIIGLGERQTNTSVTIVGFDFDAKNIAQARGDIHKVISSLLNTDGSTNNLLSGEKIYDRLIICLNSERNVVRMSTIRFIVLRVILRNNSNFTHG